MSSFKSPHQVLSTIHCSGDDISQEDTERKCKFFLSLYFGLSFYRRLMVIYLMTT